MLWETRKFPTLANSGYRQYILGNVIHLVYSLTRQHMLFLAEIRKITCSLNLKMRYALWQPGKMSLTKTLLGLLNIFPKIYDPPHIWDYPFHKKKKKKKILNVSPLTRNIVR